VAGTLTAVAEFRSPIGTRDVLAPESYRWESLTVAFSRAVERAGYGLALTPLFEDLAVFQRVGESTDVVRKEMYDFEDKGGRRIALRPEMTASIVRAYLQHRPTTPWKVWSMGPNFRYESPQAGRFRQFYQLDLEAIGSADADLDVEVIALAWRFYADLGLRQVALSLNSLGDDTCRPAYREALLQFLDLHRSELCDEHKLRLEENPLRVLDCKKPECVAVTADAPRQLDYLCDACSAHFERVKTGLQALGVPYRIDTRLVRGLDYYTRTIFSFVCDRLGAQSEIGGGGRYDGLIEQLGGAPTPAVGFAAGIERILLALDEEVAGEGRDAFIAVADPSWQQQAMALAAELRHAGISAELDLAGRSFKSQLKHANRIGARRTLILEADGTAQLRDMESGEQRAVDPGNLVDEMTGGEA
jgi:histidyl-tRNA synthetase